MTPLHTVTSVKLPNIVLAKAASKSKAHRTLVVLALNKKLAPILPEKEETIALTLNLHVDITAKVQRVAKEHGLSFSGAFAALAKAGLHFLAGKEEKEDGIRGKSINMIETKLLLGKNDEVRPLQMEFWMKLGMGLHLDKAVMVEASTGVGKGRGIISAAVMCAKEGKRPVVICAPTVKILSQLYLQEFLQNPTAKTAAKKLSLAFLPGKQEFINEVRLKEYLLEHPSPAVEKWVKDGGPVLEANALNEVARHAGIKLSWMTSDLRIVAENELRADDFILSEEDKKADGIEGQEQLQKLVSYAKTADIVFCTHTMLAMMSMSFWANLPAILEYDIETGEKLNRPVFLVDEAHLFEEAVASATSTELSLFSLAVRAEREVRKQGSSAQSTVSKLAKSARHLLGILQDINAEDRTIVLRAGMHGREENYNEITNNMILDHLKNISKLLKKRGPVNNIFNIKDDREAVGDIIKGLETGNNRVQISFSPQRRFPSMLAGKATVAPELGKIWAAATGGIGLVSATLWMPDWTGTERINYMREILCLPLDRLDAPASITWPEIYQAPTLYLPDKTIATGLIPPAADHNPTQLETWCENQARIIARHTKDAAGGTLVLCTSYTQMQGMKEAMVQNGIAEDRIVENSGRLVGDQAKYTHLHSQGKKPVWLALGPAWTGVDLVQRDINGDPVPADKDTLLTDLIITRLPIGMNRTITMETRMATNFRSIGYEAMLRLKQGLGRLIRRAGLKNRRILVLDGRLMCDPDLNSVFMKNVVASVHVLLEKYKKRSFVKH